jgi:hypothetical protein
LGGEALGEALGEAPDGAELMETAVGEGGATEPAAVDGEKMEGVATAAEAVTAALTDEETPCVLEAVSAALAEIVTAEVTEDDTPCVFEAVGI